MKVNRILMRSPILVRSCILPVLLFHMLFRVIPTQSLSVNKDKLFDRNNFRSISDPAFIIKVNDSISRRKFKANIFGSLIGYEILSHSSVEAAGATVSGTKPLVDVPMIRLRLPNGGFGREYIALKINIKGQGPYDFMLDSGLTTELITPHLQGILGIQGRGNELSALAAGGETASNPVLELSGASIDSGDGSFHLELPKLTAVVTDFPQEHIDPAHDPVEGMLGMELLSLFDVDFDFPNNRIRLFEPMTASSLGLVNIPAVVINESMLIGIRVSTPNRQNGQPILGFIDCGSTFSCINWKAAEALGLPPKHNSLYKKGPTITAVGIGNRPLTLPTVKYQISYAGNPIVDQDSKKLLGFESPPTNWKPWDPVQLAVGDIPVFSQILGDGSSPYEGPAALIGLDILAQRRLFLKAGMKNSRKREVAIAPY